MAGRGGRGRLVASLHGRAESAFERLGRGVSRRPGWVILGCCVVSAVLLAGIPAIEADFSNDSYLLPGDDTRERYDAFRDRFGLDDRIVVGLEPPEVFDLDFLHTLERLHREIENELPYVAEVQSLVNARSTRGEGDELIVEDLLERWPESPDGLPALRAEVLANPVYRNNFVSEDGRYTALLIRAQTYSTRGQDDEDLSGFDDEPRAATAEKHEYLTGAESDELVAALLERVARYETEDLRIRLAGESVLGYRATEISRVDTVVFGALAQLISMVVLWLLFRRLSAALLPALVIVLSMASTFGAMGGLGIPFSIPTQILPTFIIVVAVCDSVHVLAVFFQAHDRGGTREDAIAFALGHSGLAIVLTSLTTAGGLLSFLAAEIAPVARLGMIAPIGVAVTLFYTLTLLPALLAVVPIRVRSARGPDAGGASPSGPGSALDRSMLGFVDAVARHPARVLLATGLLVVVAATGASKLRFANDPFDWLLPEDPVRLAVLRMDEALDGVSSVEIVIDTGRENGLYEPELLHRIDRAARHALQLEVGPIRAGSAISLVDIVREIHAALHADAASREPLPDERALIAQELLLFENSGSDDLLQVSDSQLRIARLTLRVPLTDGFYYGPYLERLREDLTDILGTELDFDITGATVLGSRAFEVVLTSMARSYALALLIITPLMVLMLGSVRIGLLSMIPNLLPVLFTLALMGWLDISLNISTLLVGSVVIGLAVDDTIHLMHKFDRYLRDDPDAEFRVALSRTVATTGRALLVTTLTLVCCFGVYVFGQMAGIVRFGLLASFGAAAALLADLVVSPALLSLAFGRRQPSASSSA